MIRKQSKKVFPFVVATKSENVPFMKYHTYNFTDSGNCQPLPCPFCESHAALSTTNLYGHKAYRVECPKCHITTIPICPGGGHSEILPDGKLVFTKYYTDQQAKEKVIGTWNRRTNQ